jgi:hypothetical protein
MPWTDKDKQREYNREYMRKKREAAKAAGVDLRSGAWRKENPDAAREIERRYAERHPERIKQKAKRQRESRKARGLKEVRTEERKAEYREYMRRRRAEARALGITLPGDTWNRDNPERRRETERAWRERNPELAREITRRKQAERRSTPWGRINNNVTAVLHYGVRVASTQRGKYSNAVGYTWAELRAHLEAQFTPAMNWDNWGDVWELDHIKPLSSFKYQSLDDPLFRECWALANLRPLLRLENATKGNKPV